MDPKRYSGELQLGYYLDDREKKILKKLPHIPQGSVDQLSPLDGCSFLVRKEATQKRPHYLFDNYYINICKEN